MPRHLTCTKEILVDQKTNSQNKTARSIAPFASAPHAVYNGQPVRIAAVGDLEGFSPAYLIVDQKGQSSWQRQADVTIVDPDLLPLSPEALQTIAQAVSR
jgi:hypothetical protein